MRELPQRNRPLLEGRRLVVASADRVLVSGLLHSLVALLASDPSPEPATHLNPDAARLYFSRSADEQKEYRKLVKRCVQRSVDG